jgi:hypothetical protein
MLSEKARVERMYSLEADECRRQATLLITSDGIDELAKLFFH